MKTGRLWWNLVLWLSCTFGRAYAQNLPACDWRQVGPDLDGERAGDEFGSKLAFSDDGTTLAIGTRLHDGLDGTETEIGQVKVFVRNGGVLEQLGSSIYGQVAGDFAGASVSLSGNGRTVAIGSSLHEDFGGQVRVFRYSNEMQDWQQLGSDLNGPTGSNSLFGSSVSLSDDGSILAVAAAIANRFVGQVQVYRLVTTAEVNATDTSDWQQMGQSLQGMGQVYFGYSICLSQDGQKLAIGIWGSDETRTDSGQAVVFQYSETFGWTQIGDRINGLAVEDGHFGGSISLSGDGSTVAIGASGDVFLDPIAGYAQVFSFDGTSWVQLGRILRAAVDGDRAGSAVALSRDGRILAVSSSEHDGSNGVDSGHVRVFHYHLGDWVQIGTDIGGESGGDNFGRSLALVEATANGGVVQLAVSARYNDGNGDDSGHVRWFTIESSCVSSWLDSPSNTWSPTFPPTPSPTIDPLSCEWIQNGFDFDGHLFNDRVGVHLVISGDGRTIAIVDWKTSLYFINGVQDAAFPGAVRVFTIDDEGTIGSQIGRTIVGEDAAGALGTVVALSYDGSTMAIGVPYFNLSRGQVRVYKYSDIPSDWIQVGPDFVSERADASQESLGASVALSSDGTIVAMGASFYLGTSIPGGRVAVFRLVNDTAWMQIGGDLFGNDLSDERNLSVPGFGASLSLSSDGTVLVVGAPESSAGGQNAGRVHFFQRNGSGWARLGNNTIEGKEDLEGFGYQVAASSDGGTVAVVGRPLSGSILGVVRVYKLLANSIWTQLGNDIVGEGVSGDAGVDSGLAVSLSDDGLVLVVGAPGRNEAGSVRIFRFQPAVDDWVLVGSEIPGEASGDQFGNAVSIAAASPRVLLAVGGRLNGQGGIDAGHVRLFSVASSCISDDIALLETESELEDVTIEFIGVSETLETNSEKTTFEAISKEWFDDFFLENVQSVREMASAFSVKDQQIIRASNISALSNLKVLYSQRLSYLLASGNNLTAEELVALPFADVEATEEYRRLLRRRLGAFSDLVEIKEPLILQPEDPPTVFEETQGGLSIGAIAGIVGGAFAGVLVVAFLAFRFYKARLPVGELLVDSQSDEAARPAGFSSPVAYRVAEETTPLEEPPNSSNDDEHAMEPPNTRGESRNDDEGPDFKDQVRYTGADVGLARNTREQGSLVAEEGPDFKDQVRYGGEDAGSGGSNSEKRQIKARINVDGVSSQTGRHGPDFKDQVREYHPFPGSTMTNRTTSDRSSENDQGHTANTYGNAVSDGPRYKDQMRSVAQQPSRSPWSLGVGAHQVDSRGQTSDRSSQQLTVKPSPGAFVEIGDLPEYKDQVQSTEGRPSLKPNMNVPKTSSARHPRQPSRGDSVPSSLDTPLSRASADTAAVGVSIASQHPHSTVSTGQARDASGIYQRGNEIPSNAGHHTGAQSAAGSRYRHQMRSSDLQSAKLYTTNKPSKSNNNKPDP